jgi:hypothetical protein
MNFGVLFLGIVLPLDVLAINLTPILLRLPLSYTYSIRLVLRVFADWEAPKLEDLLATD